MLAGAGECSAAPSPARSTCSARGLVVVIGEIALLWPHLAEPFSRALTAHLLPCVRQTRIDVRPWDDDLIAVGAAGIVLAAPLAAPRQKPRQKSRQKSP